MVTRISKRLGRRRTSMRRPRAMSRRVQHRRVGRECSVARDQMAPRPPASFTFLALVGALFTVGAVGYAAEIFENVSDVVDVLSLSIRLVRQFRKFDLRAGMDRSCCGSPTPYVPEPCGGGRVHRPEPSGEC